MSVATQISVLFCNKVDASFQTVYLLEEMAAMLVLKAESGSITNAFNNLKLIQLFVSHALQPISSTQETNARERKKDVLSTDKMFVSHVSHLTYWIHFQENVSEEHQVVSTMTRPNVFHVKVNTFTTKANKDVSSLVVLSMLITADVANAAYSSS